MLLKAQKSIKLITVKTLKKNNTTKINIPHHKCELQTLEKGIQWMDISHDPLATSHIHTLKSLGCRLTPVKRSWIKSLKIGIKKKSKNRSKLESKSPPFKFFNNGTQSTNLVLIGFDPFLDWYICPKSQRQSYWSINNASLY